MFFCFLKGGLPERGEPGCHYCRRFATRSFMQRPLCDEHYGIAMRTAAFLKGQGDDAVTWKKIESAADGWTNIA